MREEAVGRVSQENKRWSEACTRLASRVDSMSRLSKSLPKDLATTGKFAQSICVSCFNKIKYHKRPHKAELINGKGVCTRCHMYGQSNNCIRPHQVDLDESDDNDF